MTKQEQNNIIKQVWTEHLQRTDDIPTDIANKYSLWVRGIIKTAVDRLKANVETQAGDEQPAA